MRLLSHCQRARSEVVAALLLWRAASTRWLSVVISAAAAKHNFCCVQRNINSRSRTCQLFMRPRQLGLRTNYLRGNRKRCHLRSHQFPRSCCNCTATRLASPQVWCTIFEIPRTPIRFVTTPHSLLGPDNSGVLVFADCCGAGLPAHCHPPLGILDELQQLSLLRKMKVVTGSLETDVHWIAVRKAS